MTQHRFHYTHLQRCQVRTQVVPPARKPGEDTGGGCHLHFHYTPAGKPGEDSGGATCTLNRRPPQNQHCHTLTFPQNCGKLSCCCPSHPAQSFVMSRPTASQSATGAYQFFRCLPFQFLCPLLPQHSSCQPGWRPLVPRHTQQSVCVLCV